jgi:hypothetical protein
MALDPFSSAQRGNDLPGNFQGFHNYRYICIAGGIHTARGIAWHLVSSLLVDAVKWSACDKKIGSKPSELARMVPGAVPFSRRGNP